MAAQGCGELAPFLAAQKAVFAVDYPGRSASTLCARQRAAGILDGLIKDEPPSGASRRACAP